MEERTIEKINDDNIITDPNFINYPCAKIIVEQAYGVCSPLNQLLLDIFEANDKVNLVYAVSSTIPGNGRTSQTYTFNPATKTMDIKSLLIGFLLATSVMLFMGAKEEPMEMFVTSSDNGRYQGFADKGKLYLVDTTTGQLFYDKKQRGEKIWQQMIKPNNRWGDSIRP